MGQTHLPWCSGKSGLRMAYCSSQSAASRIFHCYTVCSFVKVAVRRLFCIFLLLLLPLHSLAVQRGWLSHGATSDLTHELEHVEGISHHHDNHGSIHYDESDESTKHFYEHSAAQQTAVLPSFVLPPLAIAPLLSVVSGPLQYISDPIPERPQRPPKSLG